MMYMHHLRSITKFCNKTGWDGLAHDREAQNPQNRMCNGKSSWEVMNNHQDFENGNNKPIHSEFFRKPEFKIVRAGSLRIAMVYDVSGSMDGPRLATLQRTVRRLFLSKTIFGAFVGSAEFSTQSIITHNMTRVITDDHRQSLINKIPLRAIGATCIGCGLQAGLQLLSQTEDGTNGGAIIIITDGEENKEPWIREVAEEVLQSGARVFPLVMIQDFSPDLTRLALCSGGRPFGYSDQGDASDMYDAIQQIMQLSATENSTIPIMIRSQISTISPNNEVELKVKVDSAASKNLEIVFTNTGCSGTTVVIKLPSGEILNKTRLNEVEKAFRYEDKMAGIWNITLNNLGLVECKTKMTVEMFSPKSNVNAVTLTTTLSSDTLDFASGSTPRLSLHGTVRQGSTPIIGAIVEAVIETSFGEVISQKLLDNGAGSDFQKDDGVYSSYFVDFRGEGMYSIKFEVTSDKNKTKALLKSRSYGSGAPPVNPQSITETIEIEPIEEFERNTIAGTVNVKNLGTGNAQQRYPPGRVTDLSVLEVKKQWIVDLSWTAIGAHLDTGKAARYKIYHGKTVNDIRQNCTGTCSETRADMIMSGNLTNPKEPGSQELFKIDFNKLNLNNKDSLFVGLKVINSFNIEGEISNIIDCRYIIQAAPPLAPPADNKSKKLSGGAIAGIVIGCIAFIAIITVIVVAIKKKSDN
ncbi:DgyrCDS14888 [Dimorphilus gyrociliatus]|nr:DgyrCDS14888 [Dimorphilus gyrociliatus]